MCIEVCTSSTISCPIRFGDPKNVATPQLRHGEAWNWKPEELDAWFASGGTSKANRCEVDHDLTMGLKLENGQNLLLKWKKYMDLVPKSMDWVWFKVVWYWENVGKLPNCKGLKHHLPS